MGRSYHCLLDRFDLFSRPPLVDGCVESAVRTKIRIRLRPREHGSFDGSVVPAEVPLATWTLPIEIAIIV